MRITLFAVLASSLCALSGSAMAGGGAATDAYDDIRPDRILDLHGLADLYLQANFGAPASETNQFRAFDTRANQPALGLLRLTGAHAPDPLGFRLDLAAGDFADNYLHFDPAATQYPALSRGLSYVEQAFVTVKVPVAGGLSVDAGKFGTPVGLEDNEALTNWNYSRSLLYLLAEPSYHTGLRATLAATPSLAFSAFWVNGWDTNVLDGNAMRTFAGAVTWNPSAKIEVVADYMGGPERAPTRLGDPTLAFRSMLDAYATYDLTREVSFAWTGDYGHDATCGGVAWWGAGGYLRYRPREWVAWTVRGEHYDDSNGFTTGTRQRLAELTSTFELRDNVGPLAVIGRVEYRRDQSDARVFQTSTRLSPRQDTLGLSLLTAF
jgi:Putative beta-barrel porin-2, OmpL-like. bbp2